MSTTLPSEKYGSVGVTFTCAITHQKHLPQSGRSTRSAVDIFNTLRLFTTEPIREQEIKLECMNVYQFCVIHDVCLYSASQLPGCTIATALLLLPAYSTEDM